MLKSIYRIKEMIDEGRIKRIYISDEWHFGTKLMLKIDELFGDKVEVCILRHSLKRLEGIRFTKEDCILFHETIIDSYDEIDDYIRMKAKEGKAFMKIISEDIFSCKINNNEDIVYNLPEGSRIIGDSNVYHVHSLIDTSTLEYGTRKREEKEEVKAVTEEMLYEHIRLQNNILKELVESIKDYERKEQSQIIEYKEFEQAMTKANMKFKSIGEKFISIGKELKYLYQ